MAPKAKAASATPAPRRARRGPAGAAIADSDPSAIHLSSLRRSAALCHRSSGSLARHFRATWSSVGGESGETDVIGAGSSFMIAEINDAWEAPENAFFPVAISY